MDHWEVTENGLLKRLRLVVGIVLQLAKAFSILNGDLVRKSLLQGQI